MMSKLPTPEESQVSDYTKRLQAEFEKNPSPILAQKLIKMYGSGKSRKGMNLAFEVYVRLVTAKSDIFQTDKGLMAVILCQLARSFTERGQLRRAVEQLEVIQRYSLELNRFTFEVLLRASVSSGDAYLATALMDIVRFKKTSIRPEKLPFAVVVRAFRRSPSNFPKALLVLKWMDELGVQPDDYFFNSLLDMCNSHAQLHIGKEIHSMAQNRGVKLSHRLCSGLISMYSRCEDVENAWKVFREIPHDVTPWTAMITALQHNGKSQEALDLFQEMQAKGGVPEGQTFTVVLSACANLRSLTRGKEIHSLLQNQGVHVNVPIGTALVQMYGKCGSMRDAQQVFHEMKEKERSTWNTMVTGYCKGGDVKGAIECYRQMREAGIRPASVTFMGLLAACTDAGLVEEGRRLFEEMKDVYRIRPGATHFASLRRLVGEEEIIQTIAGKIPGSGRVIGKK